MKNYKSTREEKVVKTQVSIISKDALAETIYSPGSPLTGYAIKERGNPNVYQAPFFESNLEETFPLKSESGYLQKGILKLPSGVEEYETKEELLETIRGFIHDYVDLPEDFEAVCAYYVLMTWIYDRFDNVPYLRVRGNPGSGKSRFLDVMSALTYKATFFKADPTEAIIFRCLDTTRGTLLMDEADFRFSGKTTSITKILNNGFAKGSVVGRNKATKDDDYQQEFFNVFSPKILANRSIFGDDALESRCLSCYMGQRKIREEVQRSLGEDFESRSEKLRNQLLQFRFDTYFDFEITDSKDVPFNVSPRSKQICAPIISLMSKEHYHHLASVVDFTEETLGEMRSTSWEVEVLEVLLDNINNDVAKISVKDIGLQMNEERSSYDGIKPNQVGNVLTNLNIKRKRSGSGGQYCVDLHMYRDFILKQAEFYGVSSNHKIGITLDDSEDSVDSAIAEATEHTEPNIVLGKVNITSKEVANTLFEKTV